MTQWLHDVSMHYEMLDNLQKHSSVKDASSLRDIKSEYSLSGDESSNYRPQYLDHFDKPASAKTKKELSNLAVKQNNLEESKGKLENSEPCNDAQEKAQEVLNKRLFEQISGGQVQEDTSRPQNSATERGKNNTVPSTGGDQAQGKFQRCIAEGDLDFVSTLDRAYTFNIYSLMNYYVEYSLSINYFSIYFSSNFYHSMN